MTETIFQAREHQIQLTFEVKDKVERLPIKLLDLVRIASILLNNAIESAIDSLEKFVHVSLVQLDDRTILLCKILVKKENWIWKNSISQSFQLKEKIEATD